MSSLPYVQQLSKVIVAQITQTIGWNSIQTTPLELLTDILHKYLEELTRQTQRYTELYGRTEPNLDDIALAFSDLNINLSDLEEYVSNVDSVPCIVNVPKFPIPKESNLNFLKPGSKEVVTRPVHIHEHLPPIQPHEETPPAEVIRVVDTRNDDAINSNNILQTYISTNQISDTPILHSNGYEHGAMDETDALNVIGETTVVENHTSIPTDEMTFKKPFDAQPASTSNQRPPTDTTSAIGKPTREIVSCFMTTGGFISPAREGKLPDAKKPLIIPEDPEPEVKKKPRSPTPEPVERKHHSKRERDRERDNKNDLFEQSKNYSDVNSRHADDYGDEENDKEVKLYEVVNYVEPGSEAQQKKKTKKSQLELSTKEQKKQKKLNVKGAKAREARLANEFGGGADSLMNEKVNKKLQKMLSLKKKHKKQLDVTTTPEDKQHKKRMAKLSKKNLQAMGLNPNAIEGFAIPPPIDAMSYSVHEVSPPEKYVNQKESAKKMKQMQKLSNEPDKQKAKFFKKLSSTSSNLLSKISDNDRNDFNDSAAHGSQFSEYDDIAGQFGPAGMDLNASLDDLPPSKRLKMLKKLNKPPKEGKTPKIKKVKKDPAEKKQRTPKTPKEPAIIKPLEENPMSKLFLPDEFIGNVGLIDHFPVPGLNPLNPLFQSVRFDSPMPNYPFGPGLQNFDFANLSRFKRPNFNDPADDMDLTKHSRESNPPPKPLCNVASLMPPSLLSMEMHKEVSTTVRESAYTDDIGHTSSKKSVSFSSTTQYSDQVYGDDSPIVINSDDDDKIKRQSSQSPSLDPDLSYGGEVKRKKVKDKKDKEKKEKKDKETGVVKMKKKKDKKDKSKNKGDRESKPPKDKSALKKEKREKKKERERNAFALSMDTNDSLADTSAWSHSEWQQREPHTKPIEHDIYTPFNDNSNLETTIPKLTLKLGPSSSSPSSRTSRPSTPDFPMSKKSSKKKKKWRKDEDSDKSDADESSKVDESISKQLVREPSPELARISPLVTRPPKQKSSKQQAVGFSSPVRNDFFDVSTPVRDYHSLTSSTPLPTTPSGRGRPKGSSSAKSSKKSSKSSVSFAMSETDKKSQPFDNSSLMVSQMSALHTVDEQTSEENQVWICPACGRVDDGTPMIGCDGCDDWYHWVCVGILIAPNEDQDWFCRVCISRKQEDKKKKRKKKDKSSKDH